jgi:hypothetical protein
MPDATREGGGVEKDGRINHVKEREKGRKEIKHQLLEKKGQARNEP